MLLITVHHLRWREITAHWTQFGPMSIGPMLELIIINYNIYVINIYYIMDCQIIFVMKWSNYILLIGFNMCHEQIHLLRDWYPNSFMSMSLIWVYMLQRIIRFSESLYLYFIFFYVLYDILLHISCSYPYMILCDFVCIIHLFSFIYTLSLYLTSNSD
jgi:hypothetical protein